MAQRATKTGRRHGNYQTPFGGSNPSFQSADVGYPGITCSNPVAGASPWRALGVGGNRLCVARGLSVRALPIERFGSASVNHKSASYSGRFPAGAPSHCLEIESR
jgi:hypothetical protein